MNGPLLGYLWGGALGFVCGVLIGLLGIGPWP